MKFGVPVTAPVLSKLPKKCRLCAHCTVFYFKIWQKNYLSLFNWLVLSSKRFRSVDIFTTRSTQSIYICVIFFPLANFLRIIRSHFLQGKLSVRSKNSPRSLTSANGLSTSTVRVTVFLSLPPEFILVP